MPQTTANEIEPMARLDLSINGKYGATGLLVARKMPWPQSSNVVDRDRRARSERSHFARIALYMDPTVVTLASTKRATSSLISASVFATNRKAYDFAVRGRV
jgi:hypothetical protein